MIRTRSTRFTLSGLFSLVILYMLIIGLVLFFANQVVRDLSIRPSFSNTIVLIFAIALPVFLMGIVILNILKLIREKARKKPGSQFKVRLLLFFLFVVILSSVPQAILSINFIRTAMNTWFSSRVGESIRGGLDIALEYYNDKLLTLNHFVESEYFLRLARNTDQNPSYIWKEIQELQPGIDSIQILDENDREFFFAGSPTARLDPAVLVNKPDGLLPKFSVQDSSVLQIQKSYSTRNGQYRIIMSTILPANFDLTAEKLTASLQTFIQLERFQSTFKLVLFVFYVFFSFPLVLLSILISFILSEEIIQPIVNLEEATRRVAEGDFSFRILSRSNDDLSLLVSSFNKMVSELERYRAKITQTEKIAAWQEIAQRLAHEIKNPLTPIKLSAQRILRKYETDPADFEKILEPAVTAIINEVEGLNNLLTEFRNFARLPLPKIEKVNLTDLIHESIEPYRTSFHKVKFHYEHIASSVLIQADPGQLKQVFANLLKNAIEAMEEKGDIFIDVDLVKKGESNYCRIQVQDTGPGIDENLRDKVFNPYFTTKKSGTGLGLAIVERIIFDHKGQIWFESQGDAGTTFFIDVPLEQQNEQDSHNRR